MGEIRPYMCTKDARAAIDWYVESMGAEVTEGPIVMDDGRIGHVELSFGGAPQMMSDANPHHHNEATAEGSGAAVTLYLTADDVDALTSRAVGGGATLDRGPEDSDHGRMAVFRDPFGHRWMLGSTA